MRPPQTLGERIFFLALASGCLAMGVLFFLHPPEPIPEQRTAFVEHSGVLEEVLARESGRRHSLVRFRIVNDATLYESRAPRVHEAALGWRARQTPMVFYTVPGPREPGRANDARTVYGLVAGGVVTRSLEADIQHVNAMVSPWPGVLALGIGLFGYLAAGLDAWRRSRA